MAEKLIKKMKEDGFLYSAVDVPDGTYTGPEMTARIAEQAKQFAAVYPIHPFTKPFLGEKDGPEPTDGPA